MAYKHTTLILVGIFSLILSSYVYAESNSLITNPKQLFFNISAGDYAADVIYIYSEIEESKTVYITIRGDINDLLSLEKSEVAVSKEHPAQVKVFLRTSKSTTNGLHKGSILLSMPLSSGGNAITSAAVLSTTVDVGIEVRDGAPASEGNATPLIAGPLVLLLVFVILAVLFLSKRTEKRWDWSAV